MRGLVALLCVGTAHALGETCSTLWSKLAHLGCRPQDQPLRDHLDTLTLADGGVVTLRCTEGHELCYRTDRAAELSQQPSSLALTPEPFPSVAHSANATAAGPTRITPIHHGGTHGTAGITADTASGADLERPVTCTRAGETRCS